MKTTLKTMLKRDRNVISRGVRNSVRALVRWINSASDREATKKRALITIGVPCGFIFLGSEYPVVAVSGAFLLLIFFTFWFARVEEQEMTFHATDFCGPYQLGNRIVDFPELLGYLARSSPEASLEDLGDALYEDFQGPDLDEAELAGQLRRLGIPHPSLVVPSPAEDDAPAAPETDSPAGENMAPPSQEGEEGGRASWVANLGSHLKVSLAKAGNRRSSANEEVSDGAT